tara:strand:- start:137 stop:328 length:192 start_codon:yes stop_codon:yes gene_type:complete
MENWQFLYVNLAICGFILQISLIAGVYLISKSLPEEKTDREFLEGIYKQPSLSGYFFKNYKFK